MHPWSPVSCVDCHGGNGAATTAAAAHVAPSQPPATDERVAPPDYDLAYRRFVNPTDLRVVQPHLRAVPRGDRRRVQDLAPRHDRGPPLRRPLRERRREEEGHDLRDLPDGRRGRRSSSPAESRGFQPSLDACRRSRRTTADVARKNCMQCHAWSRGRARARAPRHGRRLPLRGLRRLPRHLLRRRVLRVRGPDHQPPRAGPPDPARDDRRRSRRTPARDATTATRRSASTSAASRSSSPGSPPARTSRARRRSARTARSTCATTRSRLPTSTTRRGMQCVDCHTTRDAMGDGEPPRDDGPRGRDRVHDLPRHLRGPRRSEDRARREARARCREDGGSIFLTSKVTGQALPREAGAGRHRPACDPDFNDAAREAMTAAARDARVLRVPRRLDAELLRLPLRPQRVVHPARPHLGPAHAGPRQHAREGVLDLQAPPARASTTKATSRPTWSGSAPSAPRTTRTGPSSSIRRMPKHGRGTLGHDDDPPPAAHHAAARARAASSATARAPRGASAPGRSTSPAASSRSPRRAASRSSRADRKNVAQSVELPRFARARRATSRSSRTR